MADRQQMKRRQQFLSLMDEPTAYFGKARLTLFPNGEKGEIWIQHGCHSFSIKAGVGPAGLSLQIDRHAGCAPITISGNLNPDYKTFGPIDAKTVSLCQYHDDEWTRAFRIWYSTDMKREDDGTEKEIVPHPGTPDHWNDNRAEWLKTVAAALSGKTVCELLSKPEMVGKVEAKPARDELLQLLLAGEVRLDVALCVKDENLKKLKKTG